MNFPNISPPSYPFGEELENNSLASKFEDGAVQSRRKFTKSRRTWTLKWQGLSNSEYLTLRNFIRNEANYSANTFTWKNPADNQTVVVRINNVGKWEMNVIDRWNGELTLQEV